MSGGQQITSGQGTLSVSARHGQEIISGQGILTIGIGQNYALTGGASTSAAGTHGSARLLGLRSRKVGGGAAIKDLTGVGLSWAQGQPIPGPVRTPTGQVGTFVQGAFSKISARDLTGAAVTSAPGTLTGGLAGGPGTVTWTAVPGAAGYLVYWGTSSGPPYANSANAGNTTSYLPTGLVSGTTYYFNVRSYDDAGPTLPGPFGTQQTKVA